jgi:AcrR family transcriptional regulator
MDSARAGRARSESSRQAILEATRLELIERGYDKLSIDRIATAAGVGKQTIYRWYPSKSALVAEGVLLGHLMPTEPVPDTGDIRADLTAWLSAFSDVGEGSPTASLIRATIAATAEDATIAQRYDEQVTALTRTALAVRLRSGVEAGQLRAAAPLYALIEIVVGVVLFHVITRQEITPVFVGDLVHLLLTGVGASAAESD